ncbi:hypothetical protein CK203_019607 [Vitis vinifera]|uniref:Uncharacterized protein n=1 Tax=Vitis vinifera TaxID=29760 RepID=A0A438JQR3_VITVI|nr:hypothetical protein CK203_019607 [Vitis vinifera]
MDQRVVIVDQFTIAMASIQEALASLMQEIGSQQTWVDLDSILVASLLAKFRMPDIERYTGVGYVSRKELKGFKQRSDESISSFISRWQGKIAEIVDRPL